MKNKKEKRISINIRVTEKEKKLLEARAKRFTKPENLSEWLRVAGLLFKPVKSAGK